ncbi:hypothetical protein MKEN_00245000 [Mycena kentingensis (nom. inval.)]|nr:hypothetical protein MKEN_00245000 [Mycena kentingensis (nom. inval.)]
MPPNTLGKWLVSGSSAKLSDFDLLAQRRLWGSGEVNVEGWRPLKRLPGHESDVTDVAWSPGDRYLASVGLLLSPTAHLSKERIRKLEQRQGFVKGNTKDWSLEAEVTKPFEDSPGSTLFRQLSWSPDGTHITASNATNNKGFVFIASVITHNSWTSDISLVGHENTVEVASYNPHIFLRDPDGSAHASNICSVVALVSVATILTSSDYTITSAKVQPRAKAFCSERFGRLWRELSQSPICHVNTEQYYTLTEIVQLLRNTVKPSSPNLPPVLDHRDAAALQAPSRPSTFQPFSSLPSADLHRPSNRHPYLTILLSQSERSLSRANHARLLNFGAFLMEAIQLSLFPEDIQERSVFQNALLRRPDFLHPCRELAPSRTRAGSAEGPYTADLAATPHGFASCMTYRAVLYGGEFGATYSLRYVDLTSFKAEVKRAKQEYRVLHHKAPRKLYFCHPAAYGPANKSRKIQLADVYFQNASTVNIGALLKKKKKRSLSFSEFWAWLRGKTKGAKRFPGVGPLTAYLIAADYTYTTPRLVEPPTIEELGNIICTMNKGAVAGLELLGLIPHRARNKRGRPGKIDT